MNVDKHKNRAFNTGNIILLISAIISCLVFLYAPLLSILKETLISLISGEEIIEYLIPLGRRFNVFSRTIVLGLCVAISGMMLSVFIAAFFLRYNSGKLKYLRWFILVFAAIPPYIQALAWTNIIFELNGFLSQAGLFQITFEGFAASFWVQLLSFLPFAVAMSLMGLTSIDKNIIEASRVVRTDISTFIKLTFPLAMPMILAGAAILFLLSIIDYSVPSLFQLNVYSLEIYAEFSSSADISIAFLFSLPVIIVSLFVLILCFSRIKKATFNPNENHEYYTGNYNFPLWFRIIQWIAIVILLLQILIPFFSIVSQIESWNDFIFSFKTTSSEIGFSFFIAAVTALIALPVSWIIAGSIVNLSKGLLFWLIIIPFLLPPPISGIGLISFWNTDILNPVYNSWFMLVLAGLARYLPFTILIMIIYLKNINQELLDSARIIQKNHLISFFRIKIPLLLPGIIASAFITFILTLGELGASLMIAPPGKDTLTIRIYNYLHYGESSTVASLCLVILTGILITGLLTYLVIVKDIKHRGNA